MAHRMFIKGTMVHDYGREIQWFVMFLNYDVNFSGKDFVYHCSMGCDGNANCWGDGDAC